jgi:hypothetical protein
VIENQLDKPSKFQVETTSARTNENVIIDYSPADEKVDDSMKYPFNNIAHTNSNEVTVNAKSSRNVEIKVKMPEEKFKGMILGGIYVTRVLEEAEKEKSGYTNQYSYAKGVVITESDQKLNANLKLMGISANVENFTAQITANIQNPVMTNLSNVTIDEKIYKKGSKVVFQEKKVSNRGIAPNTNFNFSIAIPQKEIKAGDYDVVIDIQDEVGHKWQFKDAFHFTEEKAAEVQKGLVFKGAEKKPDLVLYILLGVVAALLVAGIVILIVFMKKKKISK